jgi:hypothetical protein
MEYYNKKYFPGKGYKGICSFCNEFFYGRLNKKYHKACKIANSNQKASRLNKEISPIKNQIIKNDHILKKYYFVSKNENGIHKNILYREGFDTTIFTSMYPLNENEYYRINKYAYYKIKETNKIIIVPFIQLKIKYKL